MAHVTFLGTGLIGAAMVEAALHRGDRVTVWNRTIEKARALAPLGAKVATSPADAVRGAERVHVVLTDDAAVDAVLDPVLDAIGGAPIVDHTTSSPAATAARHARLSARAAIYQHAPIFMSPAAARAARGTILASGPRATFERVEPALAAMTGKVVWLGERPDLAAAYKLFGNAAILAMVGALADVYTLGDALGIPPDSARELFSFFDPSAALAMRAPKMAARDWSPSFDLATARKDVRLMIEAAPGRDLAILPGLAARMDALLGRGHAADDVAVLGVDADRSRR